MNGWLAIVILDGGVLLLLYAVGCAADFDRRPAEVHPTTSDPGREAIDAAVCPARDLHQVALLDEPAGRRRRPTAPLTITDEEARTDA